MHWLNIVPSLEKWEECLTFWITVKPSVDHFQPLMGSHFYNLKYFKLFPHKKILRLSLIIGSKGIFMTVFDKKFPSFHSIS